MGRGERERRKEGETRPERDGKGVKNEEK